MAEENKSLSTEKLNSDEPEIELHTEAQRIAFGRKGKPCSRCLVPHVYSIKHINN